MSTETIGQRDAGGVDAPRAGGAEHGGRIPISVVIPVLDEAERIAATVASVAWADDVIVVDGGSRDATRELAEAAGARVLVVRGRTIGAQRNAGIASARHDWILALDVDERVTDALRESLARLARGHAAGAPTAYRVRSRNWHLGRELRHGPWGRDWKVRVFTRAHRFTEQRVHEHVDAPGDVGTIDGALLHWPYRDLPHHVSKVATYSRWAADDLHARGRRVGLSHLVVRPAWRFFRDYVVYAGWRDGRAGFVVSVVSAFSVFAKYASLDARPSVASAPLSAPAERLSASAPRGS